MATTLPGLDSMVGDQGLSNNIYLLSDKQDAIVYRQPSLNQLAANKSSNQKEKIQCGLILSPRNRILENF